VKPDLLLRDNFGASESGNDGAFTIDQAGDLRMPPSPNMILVDELLNEIPSGSEELGYIARIVNIPLGYYKDEDKTARTFPTRRRRHPVEHRRRGLRHVYKQSSHNIAGPLCLNRTHKTQNPGLRYCGNPTSSAFSD
jgi:hypothetical protein